MFALKGKNEREIARLFKKFAKKYRHEYSDTSWEFIEENFWTYIYSNVCPDILMQIYKIFFLISLNFIKPPII